MSSISTHVLDTSLGKPAEGISITLYKKKDSEWEKIAGGVTNKDGRIGELAGKASSPGNGVYRIRFETGDYFNTTSQINFYPFVEIVFEITSDEHYHIPLLLSPFGYTTYRGS